MSLDNNRLLIDFDRIMRECNQEIINPEIPDLTIDKLVPVMQMVAHARADYLKYLYNTATDVSGVVPSDEQIQSLEKLRQRYKVLLQGAKELELAIQRGYLTVADEQTEEVA